MYLAFKIFNKRTLKQHQTATANTQQQHRTLTRGYSYDTSYSYMLMLHLPFIENYFYMQNSFRVSKDLVFLQVSQFIQI